MRTQPFLAVIPLVALVAAQGAPGGQGGQQSTGASKDQGSNRPYHFEYSALQGTSANGYGYESHISSGPVADDAGEQKQSQSQGQGQSQQQQQSGSSSDESSEHSQKESSHNTKHSHHHQSRCAADSGHSEQSSGKGTHSQGQVSADGEQGQAQTQGSSQGGQGQAQGQLQGQGRGRGGQIQGQGQYQGSGRGGRGQYSGQGQLQGSGRGGQGQLQGQGQYSSDKQQVGEAQKDQDEKAGAWESKDSSIHRELHGTSKVNQTEVHGEADRTSGKTIQQDGKLTQGELNVNATEDKVSHSEKHARGEPKQGSAQASIDANGGTSSSSYGPNGSHAEAGLGDDYEPHASAGIYGTKGGAKGHKSHHHAVQKDVEEDCEQEAKESHVKKTSSHSKSHSEHQSTASKEAASKDTASKDAASKDTAASSGASEQQATDKASSSEQTGHKQASGGKKHVDVKDLKPGEAIYDADSSVQGNAQGSSQGRVDHVAGVSKEGGKVDQTSGNGLAQQNGETISGQSLDVTAQKGKGSSQQQGGSPGLGGPSKRQVKFGYTNQNANSAQNNQAKSHMSLHAKPDKNADAQGAQGGASGGAAVGGQGAAIGGQAGGQGSAAGGQAAAAGHQKRRFFGGRAH
ncbi:unnamed protein product [Sympodiomycopsis kandeliae]